MGRTVAIGIQNFETVIKGNYFYVDKTAFIKEWWENGDSVTLITRPRRFGKTLTMSMVEQFFSVKYAQEREVFEALEECGLSTQKQKVKEWYDGFIFGNQKDIYNPWSILNFIDKGQYDTYWANTSANSLVGKLIREGNRDIKEQFELLLQGRSLQKIAVLTESLPRMHHLPGVKSISISPAQMISYIFIFIYFIISFLFKQIRF